MTIDKAKPATDACSSGKKLVFGRRALWIVFGITSIVGVISILLVTVLLAKSPQVIDVTAGKIFANAIPPDDNEYPPTASWPPMSSLEVGSLIGRGEGVNCSINSLVRKLAFRDGSSDNASVNLRYRQACVSHDLCYRHGAATYGYTQADCDSFLVQDSFRLCRQFGKSVDACVSVARRIYAGVTLGAAQAFRLADSREREVYKDGGQAAETVMSTYGEFQSYPGGQAMIAAPRMMRLSDGQPALAFLLQRPGGAAYSIYTWNRGRFVAMPNGRSFLPSRYDRLPSLPSVQEANGRDALIWWRRDATSRFSTGGVFETAQPEALSKLARITPQPADAEKPDPTAQLLLPVGGGATGDLAHIIGIGAAGGNIRCGHYADRRAFKVVHLTVGLQNANSPSTPPETHCMTYGVFSPIFNAIDRSMSKNFDTKTTDSYRYLAIPPLTAFVPDGIEVTAFRRGDSIGSRFESELISASVTIDPMVSENGIKGGVGNRNAFERCWRLPETAEPFLPLRDKDNRLSALMSLHLEGDVPAFSVYHPKLLTRDGCGILPVPTMQLLPQLRGFLALRLPAFSFPGDRSGANHEATNAVAATRILLTPSGGAAKNRDGGQVSAYNLKLDVAVLRVNKNEKLDLDQTQLGICKVNATPSDLLRRIAGTVPIIADLNGDGVPDLILADTQSGIRSLGLLGELGQDGALHFRRPAGSPACPA